MSLELDANDPRPTEPPMPGDTAMATLASQAREVELYKALLKQIHGMYDNPELKRICQEAMRSNWGSVFYDKYKPAILKVKKAE